MRLAAGLFFIVIAFIFFPSHSSVSAAVRVPILMYHYIGYNPNPKDTARDILSVNPDKFEAQMNYLSQHGFTPISLDTLYAIFKGIKAPPQKPIILSFDDGYIDFYTTAFPILRKYNFHAVSFIPTGLMNQAYYMNWDQIKQMASTGLISFEDHSVTHANLAALRTLKIEQELRDSKYILESYTGVPVNFVAYPYGASNRTVQAVAKKVGFIGGLGTWYGKATSTTYNMPRVRINGQMSLSGFASAF